MIVRLFLLCLFSVTPVAALEITLRSFEDANQPTSLEFDPAFCGVWIANDSPEVVLRSINGEELSRYRSDLYRIRTVTLSKQGLLLGDGNGQFQRLKRTGEALADPFQIDGLFDPEGIVALDDGRLIVVEDEPGHILWLDQAGNRIRRINGWAMDPPMVEPQGVGRDPRSGRIYVVDDLEGSNSLFEFSEDGEFIARVSLREYGIDPEGVALRTATNTIFVAFDGGARIAEFEFQPTAGPDFDPDVSQIDCVMS